jgi:hypothetical protein
MHSTPYAGNSQGGRDSVRTQWLNIFASCYEIKTKFIIRTASNEEANIISEEGVHQGCPLGPALFCLALRLVHLLVRHARGTAIDPAQEGVSAYALQQGTWEKVLHRFNSDGDFQHRIKELMEQRPNYRSLDHDTDTLERDDRPASLDPQQTLRSYMDDQYAVGRPAPGNDCPGYHPSTRRTSPPIPGEAELAVNEVGLAW